MGYDGSSHQRAAFSNHEKHGRRRRFVPSRDRFNNVVRKVNNAGVITTVTTTLSELRL